MKAIKTILASLLLLAFASAVEAQTRIHITGSSAFRASTYTALLNILEGETYAFTGATLPSATSAIFNGTINGQPVIVKTLFTGSEAGIQTVSNNQAILFLTDRPGTAGGESAATGSSDSRVPDIAFSDTYQSSSFFFGNFRGTFYPTLNSTNTTPGLTDQIVGVIAFKFVTTEGANAALTNLTTQQARLLFSTGNPALALFTGNAADEDEIVYATGRNFGSGTRLTALAEVGLGSRATVRHYEPRDINGNRVITNSAVASFAPWPAGSVNGVTFGIFNGGYESGNEASRAMASTTPVGTQMVTLVGFDDAAANTLPGLGRELAYNGVFLGSNLAQIANGQYTVWGYQHMYYRDNTAGVVKNVADTLALRIRDFDAPFPKLSEMRVSRTTDGALVSQVY